MYNYETQHKSENKDRPELWSCPPSTQTGAPCPWHIVDSVRGRCHQSILCFSVLALCDIFIVYRISSAEWMASLWPWPLSFGLLLYSLTIQGFNWGWRSKYSMTLTNVGFQFKCILYEAKKNIKNLLAFKTNLCFVFDLHSWYQKGIDSLVKENLRREVAIENKYVATQRKNLTHLKGVSKNTLKIIILAIHHHFTNISHRVILHCR